MQVASFEQDPKVPPPSSRIRLEYPDCNPHQEAFLANCKQCGAQLPTFSFGDASPYCKTCQAQQPAPLKQSFEDVLAPVSVKFSSWLNATNVLIAINVAVFLAMVATGVNWMEPQPDQLIRWGAEYGPNTLSGQYWRLITAAFVHIGIIHIALNMWCLWSLGRLLERLLGPATTIGIYLITALGASLLSLSWDPMRMSAGASGAIFGIAGTLIPVLYHGKLNLPRENIRKLLGYVVRFSLINLIYGAVRSHTNNMAHLGGLVAGLAAGFFLARSFALPEEERNGQRRTVLLVTASVLALFVIPVAKAKSYAVDMHKGTVALDHGDYKTAIEALQRYTAARPDDEYGHALLASAFESVHRYDEAAKEFERALQLEPDYPYVQRNLGRIYSYLNQPEKSVQMFKAASRRASFNADDYYWYSKALKETGDLDGAESAARRAVELDGKNTDAQALLKEISETRH